MRRLSGAAEPLPFLARPGRDIDPQDLAVVASLTGLSPVAAAALGTEAPHDLSRPPLGGRR